MRVEWTGVKWRRIGKVFKPSGSWGDVWRGLQEPAE